MTQFNTLLEKAFEETYNADQMPSKADYIAKYKAMKDWLNRNCYRFIGSATSAEDGSFFTDHGPEHFEEVIKYAGMLLGISRDNVECNLTSYEVFLLLSAILLHDAGNVFSRHEHEKKPMTILNQMGVVALESPVERKIIADIAASHGGKVKGGDKDTINARIKHRESNFISISYRPRLVAAIVRFADEICENQTRTSPFLTEITDLPKTSQVFHLYANSISSCTVDLISRRVNVHYTIYDKDVKTKFGKLDSDCYLIDEIFDRVEKMYQELMYCSKFFDGLIAVDGIRARITLYDEEHEEIDELTIDSGEGYPSEKLNLSKKHPNWVGENLNKRIGQSEGDSNDN
ncbi:hypothetical protein [Alteromonas sp. H39]|uniref:HD domain-containing protein n=1 Tax=Alteromonas sp. H39 TaxID=3389876 RepID=UPI0039E0FE93